MERIPDEKKAFQIGFLIFVLVLCVSTITLVHLNSEPNGDIDTANFAMIVKPTMVERISIGLDEEVYQFSRPSDEHVLTWTTIENGGDIDGHAYSFYRENGSIVVHSTREIERAFIIDKNLNRQEVEIRDNAFIHRTASDMELFEIHYK